MIKRFILCMVCVGMCSYVFGAGLFEGACQEAIALEWTIPDTEKDMSAVTVGLIIDPESNDWEYIVFYDMNDYDYEGIDREGS